jgi:hypothetical protein
MVEPDRPQMAVRRMRFACWIPKCTNRHSEYVIRIALHGNGVCTNASQCHVIGTLSLSLSLFFFSCCKCCAGAGILTGLRTGTQEMVLDSLHRFNIKDVQCDSNVHPTS